jgi:hypothetical protein
MPPVTFTRSTHWLLSTPYRIGSSFTAQRNLLYSRNTTAFSAFVSSVLPTLPPGMFGDSWESHPVTAISRNAVSASSASPVANGYLISITVVNLAEMI